MPDFVKDSPMDPAERLQRLTERAKRHREAESAFNIEAFRELLTQYTDEHLRQLIRLGDKPRDEWTAEERALYDRTLQEYAATLERWNADLDAWRRTGR